MSLKLAKLEPPNSRHQEVVDTAKLLLARAESGEFVDFCYVATKADGEIACDWTSTGDQHRRIAGAAQLQWQLCKEADESS